MQTILIEEQLRLPQQKVQVHLEVSLPEVIGIQGENGIGKSSFIRHLLINKEKYFKDRILAYLFQGPLVPLGDNCATHLFDSLAQDFSYFDSAWKKKEIIEKLHMTKKIRTPLKKLSGGENQMIKLLMVFFTEADFYFFDEPFNHLDSSKTQIIKEEIIKLKNSGKTIFLIDHNQDFLNSLADKILSFENEGEGIRAYVK